MVSWMLFDEDEDEEEEGAITDSKYSNTFVSFCNFYKVDKKMYLYSKLKYCSF